MLALLLQCYANKQIFTCGGHKQVHKNKQKESSPCWQINIGWLKYLYLSEQHVGTYNHYNIMNTNYTKIHTRFFNDFVWCNLFGKRGYACAME